MSENNSELPSNILARYWGAEFVTGPDGFTHAVRNNPINSPPLSKGWVGNPGRRAHPGDWVSNEPVTP